MPSTTTKMRARASLPPPPEGTVSTVATDAAVIEAIGRQLRGYYRRTMNEPVPDELVELVVRLERASGAER